MPPVPLGDIDTNLTNITGTIGQHDPTYTTSKVYRGNAGSTYTPTASIDRMFDIAGNVASTTTNGVTTSTDTSTNSSTNYTVPATITTNSLSTSLTWSGFLGLQSQTGPNGDTGSVAYDATARPASSTSPFGAQTTYTYADTASPPVHTATTNGHWVQTQLDGFGRTLKTTTGYASTSVSIVDTNYAPCACSPIGKMWRVSQPYAPGGTPVWTTYTYDGAGRTLSVALPDGSTTQYAYLGNQVTVTDAAGHQKTYTMDALGNLTSVAETDPTYGAVSTAYTYDVLGHLTGVSMPRGTVTQTRSFNYNQGTVVTGYLQSATNPENGTVSYTYDGNGRVATKTDAKNQQVQYTYDSYGRLTQVRHYPVTGQAEDTSQQVNYYYDANPFDTQGFSRYTQGRLAAVTYSPVALQTQNAPPLPSFAEWYSYVRAGGVSTKRFQIQQSLPQGQHQLAPVLNFDANYTFDMQGKIATVQYPTTYPTGNPVAGPTYTYGFDAMDRPTTLTDQGNNTIVSGVSYGPSNELLTIAYGNYLTGVSYENRTYNSLLQLTGLTTSNGLIGAMNLTYTYPTAANIGKISSMTDAIVGETVQYTYDSLNRLIKAQTSSATTPWGQGFVYDGFGNLTAKQVTLGSAPTMSNPVSGATNQGGGMFDSNGNMTSVGSSTYTYDVENRMKQASPSAGGTVYYGYDTQNRRVWQWTGGTDQYGTPALYTVYFYGVTGQRLASYTVAMALTSQLVLESQVVLQDTYFGSKRVAAMDRLGSTRGAGNNSAGYYPYGEDKGTPAVNDRWKFGTYWRDSATALDYALTRYYSSTFGRFMTPDPYQSSGGAGIPQSWNRYAYVQGDPANYGDPSGSNIVVCGSPTDSIYDGSCDGMGPFGLLGVPYENIHYGSGNPCFGDGDGYIGSFYPTIPNAACYAGILAFVPAPAKKRRGYFLAVTTDCYMVPSNGGPVTRNITYQLEYVESGMPKPAPSYGGVVWEHLSGDLPNSGADSPSSGVVGTFEDQQSMVNMSGVTQQHVSQRFSAVVNGVDIGLSVPAFNGAPFLNIQKYSGYISINGNIGGQVDAKTGRLIPGTYTPCP